MIRKNVKSWNKELKAYFDHNVESGLWYPLLDGKGLLLTKDEVKADLYRQIEEACDCSYPGDFQLTAHGRSLEAYVEQW